MKFIIIALLAFSMYSCGTGDGAYDESEGTTEIDQTDTLNRETPYNTPGSTPGSTPGEKH